MQQGHSFFGCNNNNSNNIIMNTIIIVYILIIILLVIYFCSKPKPNISKKDVSVLVLSCIDSRFVESMTYNLSKSKIHNDFDLITMAGASLGALTWRQMFLDHVEIAMSLHNIKEVYSIEHIDCGMYKNKFGIDNLNLHIKNINELQKIVESYGLKFKGFILDKSGKLLEL